MTTELPTPDILSDVQDQECLRCGARLRYTGPIKLGHSTAQLQAYAKEYAAAAVAAEREACAKIAKGAQHLPNDNSDFANGWCSAALQIEQAIRGQDQKGQG